jgi:hypothetical protein
MGKNTSDILLILVLTLLSCILYFPKGMPEVPGLNNELTRIAEYVHSMRDTVFPVDGPRISTEAMDSLSSIFTHLFF